MNAHPIPPGADLIDLTILNLKWNIEDACLARKVRRLEKLSRSARRGVASKHRDRLAAATALRPAHDLPQDDWAPCPRCNFISVACDCDDFTRGERH